MWRVLLLFPSGVADGPDQCTHTQQILFLLSVMRVTSQSRIVLTSSENCIRKHFYSRYAFSKAASAFLFLPWATFPQFEGPASNYFLLSWITYPSKTHIENQRGTNAISWNILQEECGARFAWGGSLAPGGPLLKQPRDSICFFSEKRWVVFSVRFSGWNVSLAVWSVRFGFHLDAYSYPGWRLCDLLKTCFPFCC